MMTVQRTLRRRSRLVGVSGSGVSRRVGGFSYGQVAEQNLRGERISFGIDLPDMSPDMKPIYYAPERRTERQDRLMARRAWEKEREVPCVSRSGLRGSVAVALCGLLLFVFLVAWANDRGTVRATARRVRTLETRIAAVENKCAELQEQYDLAAAGLDVGYRAVDLGLISAKGVPMIQLYAPENAWTKPFDTLSRR